MRIHEHPFQHKQQRHHHSRADFTPTIRSRFHGTIDDKTEGNTCAEAARLPGWGRNTITRKLKELGLQ
ncbi:hypothetical protein C5467_07460 [Photorhabdus khanii subsp. guanajuatensis]|uniref:Uncharacterized protein n=1 Tax=Photorhabdus khanii subsp. guanajuatensis TaxID=2100166 RepID=A0A4R4JZP3_9GAMM|nr:hypothetical protein C5467_07460 [Photorhabdus khanii subsp. guanajuatensis]